MTNQQYMDSVQHHNTEVKLHYPQTIATFLCGSQNYGLATPESDVDTKSIIVPTLKQLILAQGAISNTKILANNEHAEVKDVKSMLNCIRKQNINFVEILFTDYYIVDPAYKSYIDALRTAREDIAHMNPRRTLLSVCGHMEEKYKKLHRSTAFTQPDVDRYGYDPKQLCHLVRIHLFLLNFFTYEEPYESSLLRMDRDLLLSIKRGYYDLEHADQMAAQSMKWMSDFRATWLEKLKDVPEDPRMVKWLEDWCYTIYKNTYYN